MSGLGKKWFRDEPLGCKMFSGFQISRPLRVCLAAHAIETSAMMQRLGA